jgi:hypothetical protein
MPRVSDFIRQPNAAPASPRTLEYNNFDLSGGLNTYDPPEVIKPKFSPYCLNARLNSSGQITTRAGYTHYAASQDETLDQSQTSTTGATNENIAITTYLAQKFTAGATKRITKAEIRIRNTASGQGPVLIFICEDAAGSPGTIIAQGSIQSNTITSSYQYLPARFIDAPLLTSGSSYWIVAYLSENAANTYEWSATTNTTLAKNSVNYGTSWSSISKSLNFKTYLSENKPVLGVTRAYFSNGSRRLVWAVGTVLYSSDDSTVSTIKTGLSASATQYWFAQANDYLYYSNGYDAPRKWNGTTDSVIGGSPPIFKQIIVHKNRLWGVDASDPTKLFFSDETDYEKYTSTNFVYIPAPKTADPITAMEIIQDNLIVWTRNNKYVLYGSDLTNFVLRKAASNKGAVNDDVTQVYQNYAFYLSDDGVYMFNGASDKIISSKIKSKIDTIADKTRCRSIIHDNKYYLFYPTTGQALNNRALVYDLVYESWWEDDNAFIACATSLRGSGDDGELIVGSNKAGFIMYGDSDTNDMGKRISFEYRTKYYSFEHPSRYKRLRSYYPQLEPQDTSYTVALQHDTDLKNSVIGTDYNTVASGIAWGGGSYWGGGATWGSNKLLDPSIAPTSVPKFKYIQHRIKITGVDTPVTLFGYTTYYQVQRNN